MTTDPTTPAQFRYDGFTIPGQLAVLLDAVDGMPITDAERRTLCWLSGWEPETAENIAAVIRRARAPGGRPAELLFTTRFGTPVTSSAWSVVWCAAVKRAKLPAEGFTLHSLRHYFATLLIHNGARVKTVQLALGHASADITLKTYLHEWPDQLDRTRNLVDAALGKRSSAVSAVP